MNNLKYIEKAERVIMQVGNFTLKNVIMLGSKGKDNIMLAPIYSKSYNSNKYSDVSSVSSITVRSSDYIAFEYFNFKQNLNESVFISYPNIYSLKMFLDEVYNLVNTEGVYTNNSVSANYNSTFIQSDPMAGGKTLGVMPCKIQRDNIYLDGIFLFINNENCYVEIDVNTFMAIYDILKGFDLYLNSNLLLNQILSATSGSTQENPQMNNTRSTMQSRNVTPRAPRPMGTGSAFNSRRPNTAPTQNNQMSTNSPSGLERRSFNKPVQNNTNVSQENNKQEMETVTENQIDSIINSGSNPQPMEENVVSETTNDNPLSFDNIMNEAENVELDPSEIDASEIVF